MDVNYISRIHYRDFCSTVNALDLPCVISIKAEVYPFMWCGPDTVISPPCLSIMKKHSGVEDPLLEPVCMEVAVALCKK